MKSIAALFVTGLLAIAFAGVALLASAKEWPEPEETGVLFLTNSDIERANEEEYLREQRGVDMSRSYRDIGARRMRALAGRSHPNAGQTWRNRRGQRPIRGAPLRSGSRNKRIRRTS